MHFGYNPFDCCHAGGYNPEPNDVWVSERALRSGDALTYVTQRVRAELGETRVPGRLLPPARTIAPDSAREIFMHVVRLNIEAMSAIGR